MVKPLQYIGQGLFYALLMGVIGYFSSFPTYTHLPPDETLIKLSFQACWTDRGRVPASVSGRARQIACVPAQRRNYGMPA